MQEKDSFGAMPASSDNISNNQSRASQPVHKETYSISKYGIVVSDTDGATQRAWQCVETIEGFKEVFTGHAYNGDADWSEDGIYLTHPETSEMSVTFVLPDDLLRSPETEVFFLIGLSWVTDLDSNTLEVSVNESVVECHPLVLQDGSVDAH